VRICPSRSDAGFSKLSTWFQIEVKPLEGQLDANKDKNIYVCIYIVNLDKS